MKKISNEQNILHNIFFSAFKDDGWQTVGSIDITEKKLSALFENQGFSPTIAEEMAKQAIKEAEFESFKMEHPEAPRKWRGWISKKGKEF